MAILWFSGSYLLIWWKSRYTGPGASPFSGTLSRSSAVSSNSPVWHNDRLGSYRMDLFFKPVWRKTTSGSIGYHDSCRNGLHPRNDHLWVCRSSRPSHRNEKTSVGIAIPHEKSSKKSPHSTPPFTVVYHNCGSNESCRLRNSGLWWSPLDPNRLASIILEVIELILNQHGLSRHKLPLSLGGSSLAAWGRSAWKFCSTSAKRNTFRKWCTNTMNYTMQSPGNKPPPENLVYPPFWDNGDLVNT